MFLLNLDWTLMNNLLELRAAVRNNSQLQWTLCGLTDAAILNSGNCQGFY